MRKLMPKREKKEGGMGVEEWGGGEGERERKKEYEGHGRAFTSVLVLLCSLTRTS